MLELIDVSTLFGTFKNIFVIYIYFYAWDTPINYYSRSLCMCVYVHVYMCGMCIHVYGHVHMYVCTHACGFVCLEVRN